MKNKNYYSIHRNKKKRKSTLTEFQKTWRIIAPTIIKAMLFVQKAMEASQQKRMPIPKYKLGGGKSELAIIGDNSKPEIIVRKDDNYTLNNEKIEPPIDFSCIKGEAFRKYVASGEIINKNNSFEM